MEKGFLKPILLSSQTVFTFKELLLTWNIDKNTARSRISYYLRKGDLYPIRRGLYAKNKNYDRFELATKIYTPAYISFETVLGSAGITFQYYDQIFVASYQSNELTADHQKLVFKMLKSSILLNSAGVENKGTYFIASPERAFLDVVYLNKEYHFDNLSPLDWDKVNEIVPIYESKSMLEKVSKYREVEKE
jgi:predicted transcriptional regulator of viral defense system